MKLIQCLIASCPEVYGTPLVNGLHRLYRAWEYSEKRIVAVVHRIFRDRWEDSCPGPHRPAPYATVFPSCKDEFLACIECYSLQGMRRWRGGVRAANVPSVGYGCSHDQNIGLSAATLVDSGGQRLGAVLSFSQACACIGIEMAHVAIHMAHEQL